MTTVDRFAGRAVVVIADRGPGGVEVGASDRPTVRPARVEVSVPAHVS